jgi:ABC-type multidrug transport system ATPase subunit
MLHARKIGVELGGVEILQSVDFRVRAGELIGVLGPSGSGKSTLLLALSGFRPANQGRVTFQGKDLYESFEELKTEIGFVPQDDIVPTALKVERVLGYAAELRLRDESVEERKTRVDRVIHKLGLGERKDVRVASLSGGQRKRVNVAVELLSNPTILFADEPTSGLDPALERSLTETFRKMADDGAAVVVTTHIMTSLEFYDRLAVIVKGRLAYFGPPSEAKPYFEVDDFTKIYAMLDTKKPAEWHGRFQKSTYAAHVK